MKNITTLVALLACALTHEALSFEASAPCANAKDLAAAIGCVKENEPSYRAALSADEEATTLKSSAYRLINPQLEIEYLDGKNLGDVDRESTASLLFTFEIGGKRSARARVLEAEGMNLKADAFEQQIEALTDLGGSLLKMYQLDSERAILQESIGGFRRVIRLYRSRGALPPEQKVSLHAFELLLLGYERKLIEVDASLLRYKKRVEKLFGSNAKGVPFDARKWSLNLDRLKTNFNTWVENTPEMLRVRADALKAEGEAALASAEIWPNLQIGPSVGRVTSGPFEYMQYGFKAMLPIPILTQNSAEKTSRRLTAARVGSHLAWTREDVKSKYQSLLSEMERIRVLLEEVPTAEEINRKHLSTESLYRRGMISGSLMIEVHRSLVEHYEAKHELQTEYLEGLLKLNQLEEASLK